MTSAGSDFSRIPARTRRPLVAPPVPCWPGVSARPPVVQTRLAASQTHDPLEREAEQIAAQVMRVSDPPPSRRGIDGNGLVPIAASVVNGSNARNFPQGAAPGPSVARHDGRAVDSAGLTSDVAVSSVEQATVATPGSPLAVNSRSYFEPRFGRDFSRVSVHSGGSASRTASAMGARAYTVGPRVAFAPGWFRPDTPDGARLLAHELTHVVQQGFAPPIGPGRAGSQSVVVPPVRHRSGPRVARQAETIEVEFIVSRDEYTVPGTSEKYRVGDAAGSRVLMEIQERGSHVVFRVFNFESGAAREMSLADWSLLRVAAIFGGSNAGITRLGRSLTPSQWRSLWPNPMPELLKMFESGRLALDDEAVLSGYHGMIRSEASRTLDANERTIDELLAARDRMVRLQEFATGLREASMVRDAFTQRRNELSRMLVAQHSFTFGLPKRGTGPDMAAQLDIERQRAEVDSALEFWLQAFPLLTRLQTNDIAAASVEATLREIKTNIVATRLQLDRGRLDPMKLDTVRAGLTGRLGSRATAVVEAKDRSSSRWEIAGGIALTAASIAILFLPGGVFIDAAIGVAIAGSAIDRAVEVGRAANTGLHVDDGLVSQSEAHGARLAAVLAVVFAVMGTAAAAFKVLRVGLALRGLGRSMPELAMAERASVARAIADDPALVSTFTKMAPGDTAISARVATAVRQAGGDARALRAALGDVSKIAAIPRRVPATPDAYEPLRKITDGSDLVRIANETGFSRAEVEAAKRNLMLDEHILVDSKGALYRGQFEPQEDIVKYWGRAARGEKLSGEDKGLLRRLIKHEQVEGGILGSSRQSIEQAFLHGDLEGKLRTFLQSRGLSRDAIEHLLRNETRPVMPHRYAHYVAHYSGAPN